MFSVFQVEIFCSREFFFSSPFPAALVFGDVATGIKLIMGRFSDGAVLVNHEAPGCYPSLSKSY